jgi:hypothetical protein
MLGRGQRDGNVIGVQLHAPVRVIAGHDLSSMLTSTACRRTRRNDTCRRLVTLMNPVKMFS